MARPRKPLPSRSPLVPAIVRHAAACGVDVEAMAWRFGLPQDASRLEEVTADEDAPEEMMAAVAQATGQADLALRLARELTSRTLTLAELAVRASADACEALRRLARWAPLLHEGVVADLEADGAGGEARWVLRTPHRPRGVGRHVHELVLAHALHHVRAGGAELGPSRLWFVDARPSDLAPLRSFFATDQLSFGCEDSGMAFDRASLIRPMRLADARTAETLSGLVEAELGSRPRGTSLTERVATHLTASLPEGLDVGDVARALHMSARTLQRRLEQEQTRFTEVLDRARLELARRMLADARVTLADVAFRLGFADLATFSRAFKRWTGKPPGQWRRS